MILQKPCPTAIIHIDCIPQRFKWKPFQKIPLWLALSSPILTHQSPSLQKCTRYTNFLQALNPTQKHKITVNNAPSRMKRTYKHVSWKPHTHTFFVHTKSACSIRRSEIRDKYLRPHSGSDTSKASTRHTHIIGIRYRLLRTISLIARAKAYVINRLGVVGAFCLVCSSCESPCWIWESSRPPEEGRIELRRSREDLGDLM